MNDGRTLLRWPHALQTLRVRLSLALLLVVAVAVTAGTVAHLAEIGARLENDLGSQAGRVVGAIRTDLEQTAAALDEELASASEPRMGVGRLLSSGRAEARLLGTQARLVSGRLEVLKVLQPDGAILSSGHWPASFGALDPLVALYRTDAGRAPRIVDEATPEGSSAALERWARVRAGTRDVFVVAGRFLDDTALERMRARTGADVIALCRVRASPCNVVTTPALGGLAPFDPDDAEVRARVHLEPLDVGGHTLWVGLDRSGIDRVRSGIVRRAVVVGFLSIVLAVALGIALAARLVRPIESLAGAARRLASGDLSARVDVDAATGDEVHELVVTFNQMALELEREKQRVRQAERVAAWQEIARGLAHELKNPLTPILGAIDVIKRARALQRADFDDILAEQGQAVVEEVMRLKELADAFARFARLPEQKLEPLSLVELLDHACALYAQGDDVVVQRRADEQLPTIDADRTQLMTVFGNLIKNAVEAIDGKGTLRVSVRRSADELVVVVEDSGPGIAQEIEQRLFTPYVTTKGSRGTGLGLALSHRIVAEHEGRIDGGRSDELGGAAFTVTLPLVRPASASSIIPPPAATG